mgnify:CR=1 FL=1
MKITNLTIIANFIDKNPGCRRTDIKRYLYVARTGEQPQRGYHNRVSNQYFQNYGCHHNVYLNKLWYNRSSNPAKSEYYLTPAGRRYVNHNLNRGLHKGTLVACRRGRDTSVRGLVVACNDTGGIWIYSQEQIKYFNHHTEVVPLHG